MGNADAFWMSGKQLKGVEPMRIFKSVAKSILPAAGLLSMALFAQNGPQGPGNGPGTGCGNGVCNPVVVVPATAEEVRWLTFMREEEKLARDVYRALYERWKLPVFDRIAASEQQHFTMVGGLLTRYEIADPAADDTPGVYTDPRFTALYKELLAKGDMSIKDAIEVGVLIETVDIDDLGKAIAETQKYDLKRVFGNLMQASFSHLDAFESYLEILNLT